MPADNRITVTVVVSGAPLKVAVNDNQKVEQLIREALHQAGIPHPTVAEWTLRFADGGAAIGPEQRIAAAGIADGATLFLDPQEGGGGQVAVQPQSHPEPEPPPVLVDPAVSAAKLASQLSDWERNREIYEQRGWVLLGTEQLHVDVGFTARVAAGPVKDLVTMPLAVRFCFENYDVWAPSVRVIDPITRRWLEVPRLRALDFAPLADGEPPLDLFVGGHPETGRVFLCKPGAREYHSHPEHSGDDWLLYRGRGFGTLGALCDLIWRTTTRLVTGLDFTARRLTVDDNEVTQLDVEIRQDNVDALAEQLRSQLPQQLPLSALPADLQAQLPPEIQAAIAQQ
jgi:hypothetical protein